MSSSVFKVYASSSRDGFENDAGSSGNIGAKQGDLSESDAVHEDLKIDSNLVILVNKDGSVSVDQTTLQSLLANETNDTSVSVVRISSPTPSIEEEIEEEQRLRKEEKQQLDADAGSSNEDSNEEDSVAGTSSATSSITGVAPRRGRSTAKKSLSTTLLGDDDDPKHVSLTVEAYYPPKEASNFAAQVLSLTGYEHPLRKEAVDIEYLKQLVSNDHCYTPLSSPTQKLPPRTLFDDVDSSEESATGKPKADSSTFATTQGGNLVDIRKPSSVRVIKVGPVAVIGATSTPQNKLKKPTPASVVTSLDQKKTSKPAKQPAGKQSAQDDDDEEKEEDFDSDYSDEESSYSEEDDEMDADFSVSGRTTIKKRKQTAKAKVSPKSMQRAQFKKSELKELAETVNKESDRNKYGKVVVKSATPIVKPSTPKATVVKVEQNVKALPAKKDAVKVHSSSSSSSGSTTPTLVSSKQLPLGSVAGKVQVKPDSSLPKQQAASSAASTVTSPVVPSAPVPKKEKKPKTNPHDAALFSDMSALFSTPDIIKKVNTNKAPTHSITSTTNSGNASPLVTTSSPTVKVPVYSITKSAEKKQPVVQVQTPTSTAQPHPATEQRLDLIDAIVQEDLRQPVAVTPVPVSAGTVQPQQPAEIPNIVKMLETTSNAIETSGAATLTDMIPEVKPVTPVAPVVDLLPDTSILEALSSNDDALPEELLEHVAELAKNKELQEILDKQVLGVINPDGLLPPPVMSVDGGVTNVLPQPPVVQPSVPAVVPNLAAPLTPQPQSLNPIASTPLTTNNETVQGESTIKEQPAVQRKDAILIRRSDGRVITLPPIEAPTTRASKRRSQITGPGTPTTSQKPNEQSSISMATETATAASQASTPKLSRRQSVAKGAITPSSSRPATPSGTVDTGNLADSKVEQKSDDAAAVKKRDPKVRQSVDNTRVKRVSATNVAIAIEAAQDDDYESDESWNSEDDPDRLWCICRQPHNNRFMICCDSCEDWFHGKCVNITKAMGQQMEQDGIEWTCPNCLKKKQDRQQPKLMAFWQKTNDTGNVEANTSSPKTPLQTVSASSATGDVTNCVVCSKRAKPSSIYCGDECIRKHASSTIVNAQAAKNDKTKDRPLVGSSPVTATTGNTDSSNDNHIVIVMERKTGRCLTGKNAPALENLKSWLQAHPTFELVPPGSAQASIILAKQAEVRKQQLAKEAAEKKSSSSLNAPITSSSSGAGGSSTKIQTQLKLNEQKKMVISTSTSGSSQAGVKLQNSPKISPPGSSKQIGQKSASSIASSPSTAVSAKGATTPVATKTGSSISNQQKATNSSTSVTPNNTASSGSTSKKQQKPVHTSSAASSSVSEQTKSFKGSKSTTTPAGENIHVTVKKTLKEHLMQRTAELQEDSTFARLTEEEIDRYVENTEREMFILFNKDTGMKYRAKYRSLVFNIKDRKNLSLFQKISEKLIEPKQLVRMTADELASQELAQWREKEAKHQLEMIKKSELDLLACAKNYVLKTHKGEEVIEGKTDERVQLDPSAPVEDVVLLLNNSAVSSTSELDDSSIALLEGTHRSKDYEYGGVYGKAYSGLYGMGSISSSSNVTTLSSGKLDSHVSGGAGSSSSSSRKKESRRSSRSRSRSRGRKHERDRSRDRSRSKHKRKRSRERSHERHSSRDRDREKERDRDRDRERDRERDRDRDRHHKGRERSKDRSKHERKSSREKETSTKSSSDKRRASTTSRGAETSSDPNTTTDGLEMDRKVGKTGEAQSKITGSSKKRTEELTKDSTKLPSETIVEKGVDKSETNKLSTDEVADVTVSEKHQFTEEKGIDPVKNPAISVETTVKESKSEQDQEPTSTVTIPTPPHYPYEGESHEEPNSVGVEDQQKLEAEKNYWTGSVHMIDVASIEMSIRAVSGEIHDVVRDFTVDLNICGTIKPEIVWEYIGQIKKSPNKEVCLVRFHSPEASAYYTLYKHLHSRKRYSVVKSPSASIKDFYIFPLPADQMIPMILKPLRGIGIIEGDDKPNLLLGILVKIKGGKRPASSSVASAPAKVVRHPARSSIGSSVGKPSANSSGTSKPSLMQQVITKYTSKDPTNEAVGPPKTEESLKLDMMMVRSEATSKESTVTSTPDTPANDPMDMEVDMNIIKAPITGKTVSGEGTSSSTSTTVGTSRVPEPSAMLIDDDDDEPYSPGGGSDDSNFADVTAIVDTSKAPRALPTEQGVVDPEEERIRIAMDELNRKIAEQKNEIVGLISRGDLKEEEISSALPPSLINEIPIPPNLSQILASIKGGSSSSITAGGMPSGSSVETIDEVSAGPSSTSLVQDSASLAVNRPSVANEDEEEYNPTTPSLYCSYKAAPSIPYSAIPVANSQGDIDERILPATLLPPTDDAAPNPATFDPLTSLTLAGGVLANLAGNLPVVAEVCQPAASSSEGESRLAKLSEAELLSMVPDDAVLPDSSSKDS